MRRRPWRREAVWRRSPRRTAAPNVTEPLSKPDRPGERVSKRDAQNPTEAGGGNGGGGGGTSSALTQGGLHGFRASGRPGEGNDDGSMLMQKSDLFVGAMTPVKAG